MAPIAPLKFPQVGSVLHHTTKTVPKAPIEVGVIEAIPDPAWNHRMKPQHTTPTTLKAPSSLEGLQRVVNLARRVALFAAVVVERHHAPPPTGIPSAGSSVTSWATRWAFPWMASMKRSAPR